MHRREITPQNIEAILEIFAVAVFNSEYVAEIKNSSSEFPFIHALFGMDPAKLADIFHTGSLMHDLQRVAGVLWSWDVSEAQGHLHIHFYKNEPRRDKTVAEIEREDELNRRVSEYLRNQTR